MARSRNIKPGFFTNDVLGELPPLTRLLFAGIWTICDREGRLEDRPKKIRAEVLPYDDCDPDAMLDDLQKHGFILRYEAEGIKAIQVLAWDKHQNPHVKEAPSTMPAPCKPGTSTVQDQGKEQPLPERAGLIPDSSPLIPDSSKEPTVLVPEDADASRRPSPCPNEQIVDLYHRHLPTLPRVEVLNDTRKRTIAARWREVLADPDIKSKPDPRSAAIEFFDWYFDHAAKSRFLTGKAKDWRADFDFLMTPTKFVKVIEGHYHKEAA